MNNILNVLDSPVNSKDCTLLCESIFYLVFFFFFQNGLHFFSHYLFCHDVRWRQYLCENLLNNISLNKWPLQTLAQSSCTSFSSAVWDTINSEWPIFRSRSAAITVGHARLHFMSATYSKCPHSFTSRHQLTLLCTFAITASEDRPFSSAVKFAFHTGSWPKQINQPHASKRGHEWGQRGPCREVPEVTEGGIWSRKENKLSKSEGSFLTQGPRHVSCHATATPSTQIRADGDNKPRGGKERRVSLRVFRENKNKRKDVVVTF